jgi:hypothetical protein
MGHGFVSRTCLWSPEISCGCLCPCIAILKTMSFRDFDYYTADLGDYQQLIDWIHAEKSGGSQ